jgi:cytochrome c biogenesis protein ResB
MGLMSPVLSDCETFRRESFFLVVLGKGLALARLAIVLSLLVTMLATLGTIIQPSIKEYGVLAHRLFVELGMLGLRLSWLFLWILVLFSLNLCAWPMQRLPSTWGGLLKHKGNVILPLNPDIEPLFGGSPMLENCAGFSEDLDRLLNQDQMHVLGNSHHGLISGQGCMTKCF